MTMKKMYENKLDIENILRSIRKLSNAVSTSELSLQHIKTQKMIMNAE
jgi:hypothetical protein